MRHAFSRRRWILLGCAVGALICLGWWSRDLPRLWLESRLAALTGAEVELGELVLHGRHRVELRDLTLRRPGLFPGLRRLSIRRATVRGDLAGLRRGVIEEIDLDGVRASFDVAEPPAPGDGPPPVRVGRLHVLGAELSAVSGSRPEPAQADALLDLDVSLGEPGRLEGSAHLRARQIELAPFLSWFGLGEQSGMVSDLDARWRSAAEPTLELTAGTAEIASRLGAGELRLSLRQPHLELRGETGWAGGGGADEALLGGPDLQARFGETRWQVEKSPDLLAIDLWSTAFDSARLEVRGEQGVLTGRVLGFETLAAELRLPGVMELGARVDAELSGSMSAPEAEITARLDRAELADGRRLAALGGRLQLRPTWRDGALQQASFKLEAPIRSLLGVLPEGALDALPAGLDIEAGELTATGSLRGVPESPVADAAVRLHQLRARSGELLTAEGEASSQLELALEDGHMAWQMTDLRARLGLTARGETIPAALRGTLRGRDGSVAAGRLVVEGRQLGRLEVTGSPEQAVIELAGVDTARWKELLLSSLPAAWAEIAVAGCLDGRLGWRRGETGRLRGQLRLVDADLAAPGTPLGDLAARGEIESRLEVELEQDRLSWRATEIGAVLELTTELLGTVTTTLGGDLGSRDGSISFDRLLVETPLGRLILAGTEHAADIELEGLEIGAFRERLASTLPAGLAETSVSGTLGGVLHLQRADTTRLEGELRLVNAGFNASSGARVLEGLGAGLQAEATLSRGGDLEAEVSGRLGGFLVLWDAYFGDLSELETELEMSVRVPAEGLWSGRLAMTPRTEKAATRLEVEVGGTAAGLAEAMELEIVVESRDLADFKAGVLRPFQTSEPLLGDLRGTASLQAHVGIRSAGGTSPRDFDLDGRLRLGGVALVLRQLSLNELDLDLPIQLHRRRGVIDGPPLVGSLQVGDSRVLDLALPAIASPLRVQGDDVALDEPLAIEMLGGGVTLQRLTVKDPFTSLLLESGLEVQGLSIERLTAALGLPALEGQLDGSLPKVRIEKDRLEVDGGGTIRLFGGEVRLRDITGRQIFSPFPRFRVSADIEDLDLGQLTRRFDFGEMQGVLRGNLDECVLVGGAPVAFSARFESVDRPGVPQTVDVKAVQNLTILGTGARPTLFDRGLQRFLKRYRYRKLGVAVELRDDLLELRGLVRENDRELFLQGSLVLGIDVVNAVPGQRVSYSAMMRRLQNLDFSQMRTE